WRRRRWVALRSRRARRAARAPIGWGGGWSRFSGVRALFRHVSSARPRRRTRRLPAPPALPPGPAPAHAAGSAARPRRRVRRPPTPPALPPARTAGSGARRRTLYFDD